MRRFTHLWRYGLAVAGLRDVIARLLRRWAAAADGTRALPISVQHQLQSNWCWAACATSTSGFYDPATTWGQCTLVNAELGHATCCEEGGSGACNIPWYLDRVLRRTGNFGSKMKGRAPWNTVRAELDAGRPVGARIGWKGGGGHFVMLTGYRSAGEVHEVEIQDPWTGQSTLAVDVFATKYKNSGTWTHTYLTRR
jgi:Papain-like cysteine protease AvrRpt2